MKTLCLLLVVCASCASVSVAHCQQLSDQLNSLRAAQSEYEDRQREEARLQAERERQAEEHRLAQIRAAQREQEQRHQEAAAQAKAENDERLREKARLQRQQDEEHALEMEQTRAKGEETKAMSAARAARAKEYVDADLAKQKAETDVIQSNADATRNVSEGMKELQTGIGKGAEAEGERWGSVPSSGGDSPGASPPHVRLRDRGQ